MVRFTSVVAWAAVIAASAALASQPPSVPVTIPPPASPDEPTICHYVLTSEHGSKPFKLCLTKSQWKFADSRNSKDPNAIECHIDEDPATKLTSYKICQPASAWRQDRQDARDAVEWIQRQACVPGGGCPGI